MAIPNTSGITPKEELHHIHQQSTQDQIPPEELQWTGENFLMMSQRIAEINYQNEVVISQITKLGQEYNKRLLILETEQQDFLKETTEQIHLLSNHNLEMWDKLLNSMELYRTSNLELGKAITENVQNEILNLIKLTDYQLLDYQATINLNIKTVMKHSEKAIRKITLRTKLYVLNQIIIPLFILALCGLAIIIYFWFLK